MVIPPIGVVEGVRQRLEHGAKRSHLGERWPLFHPQETFGSCCADGSWAGSKNLLPETDT
jgi:hypothetical protein